MSRTKKKHRYQLVIEFETEVPVKAHAANMIQFENGLPYFADVTKPKESLNNTFVYGTGKIKMRKVS